VKVVIFNGMSLFLLVKLECRAYAIYISATSVTPPPNDLLTIPVDAYYDAAFVGLGGFTAAQKALSSFRDEIHPEQPKTFIVTGNILHTPHLHFTPWGCRRPCKLGLS
jgi:hypothetical protein